MSYGYRTLRPLCGLLLVALVAACAVALAGCAAHRPGPEDRVLRHDVGVDETVEDIADDYYGTPRRAREIRRFNDMDRGEDPAPGAEIGIPMSPEDMKALQRRRSARVPYRAGVELASEGKYLDASVRFREAVELDPHFAEAHHNLGAAYQRMGAHEKALEEFAAAAKRRPKNADYRFAVGGSYFHLERYDRAVKEFRRALKLDPFHLQARFSLAVSLEKLGRVDAAREEWERYLGVDSDSAWADKARAHLKELGAQ